MWSSGKGWNGEYGGSVAVLSSSGVALDGEASTYVSSNINTETLSLTTTQANDVIIAVVSSSFGELTSVSSPNTVGRSGAGTAWTQRSIEGGPIGSGYFTAVYYATASAPLSGETISVDFGDDGYPVSITVFAISGAALSSFFDGNSGLPATAGSGTVSISTNTANDFLFAAYWFYNSVAAPTAGSGWTQIGSAQYQLVEYQIASGTVSGLAATVGTGSGSEYNGVGDAVIP